jgi:hypothetical protein
MPLSTEFINKSTIRESGASDYIPMYGLFESDADACNWLAREGWEQVFIECPHRTFEKELGGKKRTVEVVKFSFEPVHYISLAYWNNHKS